MRFLRAIQLAHILAGGRSAIEGRLHALLDVLLAHSENRRLADFDRLGNGVVHPARSVGALVGLEQDAGMGQLAGRGRARS